MSYSFFINLPSPRVTKFPALLRNGGEAALACVGRGRSAAAIELPFVAVAADLAEQLHHHFLRSSVEQKRPVDALIGCANLHAIESPC